MKRAWMLLLIIGAKCEAPAPLPKVETSNPNIQVELLFTVEDCRVYRFGDKGEWRYLTVCGKVDAEKSIAMNSVDSRTRTYTDGKGTTHVVSYTVPWTVQTVRR